MPPSTAAPVAGETGQARNLEPLFAPRSIAVVGASRRVGTAGSDIFRNLIYGEYTGVVYPVNPKTKSIMGIRCVPSVSALDEAVDLAVIIVPSPGVEKVVLECADKGTRHFLIISAGFKEIGGDGLAR